MCNACVSWENVDVSTISVADLLAFDALPHDVKVICAKKMAHEMDCESEDLDLDNLIEKAEKRGREEAEDENLELERERQQLLKQLSDLRDEMKDSREDRERDLCEAEDKGYRRGLAEGRRIARSEAAD